ncbi:RluA family pseudouridine synthase [Candidatus Saccharibacteria bacterium]|nr:RluA family pseudouridine synthase [Candidatus Saccharibacteria bacterium]MCL1963054.1 RluA family pseudouridine synthase [Candidatus Saccharibacteria bacterium]
MRLDKFLAEKYPDTSRAIFQKLIDSKRVDINGAKATSVRQNVSETDEIVVQHFPHQLTFADEIADFAKNVIYEDENVVVVNKPAGILTHMKGSVADEFTVSDFVKSRMMKSSTVFSESSSRKCVNGAAKVTGSPVDGDVTPRESLDALRDEEKMVDDFDIFTKSNRPGIVHRLDRATSGVLIAAKNPKAQNLLQNQFQDRKAHKTYLALVEKAPKLMEAKIDLPIGRNPKQPSEFRVDSNGKAAVTNYKVVQTFADGSALVELKPLTGRTHQLRVHLSYINAPIVGDAVYNVIASKAKQSNPDRHGDESPSDDKQRMFLHAKELEITIPGEPNNERKIFTADLPQDFQDEIARRGSK